MKLSAIQTNGDADYYEGARLALESKDISSQFKIPRILPVKAGFRITGCDASVMEVVAIEGDEAIYRGVCANRHQYKQRIQLTELQNKQFVEEEDFSVGEDGKLKIGDGEGFAAGELESF